MILWLCKKCGYKSHSHNSMLIKQCEKCGEFMSFDLGQGVNEVKK